MKKLLILTIICCLAPVTMLGQQVNPSKTRLNNILLIDQVLEWTDVNIKKLFYLKDLSFDDIRENNVIIEETEYNNKFGNYVLSDSRKTYYIVRQVDSDCIYVHNILCFKSKPDSLVYARLNKEGSNICRDDFSTSYIFLEQTLDGKKGWHCYYKNGNQKDFFDMNIDSQGRIITHPIYKISYSLDNNLLRFSGNSDCYDFKWNKSYLTSHEIFEAAVEKEKSGEEGYNSYYAKIEETVGNRWKTVTLYRHEDNKMVPKFRITRRISSTLDTQAKPIGRDLDSSLPEPEDVLTFQEDDPDVDSVPFQLIETKPQFDGGGISKFSQWLQEHLIYPATAEKDGVQGRVTLQFNVNADGSVSDVKVLRGVDPALDEEAVRIVSMSPKWEPGKQRGRAVIVSCTVSVLFTT